MATSPVLEENCIICNQPSVKNKPLHKCITCSKYIHRRCSKTSSGITAIHCQQCLLNKEKEEKRKTNTKTALLQVHRHELILPLKEKYSLSIKPRLNQVYQALINRNIVHPTILQNHHHVGVQAIILLSQRGIP